MYVGIRHDMLHYISRGGHGANISVTRSPFFTTVLEMQENFKRYHGYGPKRIYQTMLGLHNLYRPYLACSKTCRHSAITNHRCVHWK
jgi:hypothetical protein